MPDGENDRDNDKWTKLMFVVLAFFGVSTLLLGILKISNIIKLPMADYVSTNSQNIDFSQGLENLAQSAEELKNTDTDKDGLSDYDEMYVYNTSIYLADSDSDGYTDKEEIDGGYDPNCPKGMNCRSSQNNSQQPSSPSTPPEGQSVETPSPSQLPSESKEQLKNLSADEVRQLLLASGKISQEELDKIDDITLMQVFQEMLDN